MLHLFSILNVFGWIVLAAATPTKLSVNMSEVTSTLQRRQVMPASQCYTGQLQCCNTVMPANQYPANALLALLGITVNPEDTLVGITCTPITVIGVGGGGCTAQPVCCYINGFNGIVSIGCVPVNLSL